MGSQETLEGFVAVVWGWLVDSRNKALERGRCPDHKLKVLISHTRPNGVDTEVEYGFLFLPSEFRHSNLLERAVRSIPGINTRAGFQEPARNAVRNAPDSSLLQKFDDVVCGTFSVDRDLALRFEPRSMPSGLIQRKLVNVVERIRCNRPELAPYKPVIR